MSGGAMNYAYHHLNEAAEYVDDREIKELLNDLADVLHDIEWYQSGDIDATEYFETLQSFKKKWFGESRNERLQKYIDESCAEFLLGLHNLIGE